MKASLTLGTPEDRRRRQVVRELGRPPGLRYLRVRGASELTIGDARQLLDEYRWLWRALQPHLSRPAAQAHPLLVEE